MRSNYKKLGKYIEEVSVKNMDLAVETLLGVSIQKILIPSIANTIGSDMSKYKVIKKNQFAYGPVTSRNGDKISVALLKQYDKAIISQSYKVFEVIDVEELLPEYLMMWFSRPEFDRYARFMSHGSTRETFDWEEMCEVELPVPPIAEQRAIVEEYNLVTDRIKLNEQIIAKLEETAQALYKHWFVDFDFPDENGDPYKSSGGKMVFNEELDKEVPEGWKVEKMGNIATIIRGASPRPIDRFLANSGIPWVKISDATGSTSKFLYKTKQFIKKEGLSKSRNVEPETLILSNSASPGLPIIMKIEACVHDGWLIFKNYKNITREYVYQFLKINRSDILSNSNGSIFKNLKTDILKSYLIIVPKIKTLDKYTNSQIKIDLLIERNSNQIEEFVILKSLLLSKMASDISQQKISTK